MAKRKAISKKLRFEVFKRDKFTCQYCGKSAPNVILEVDHIKPVAKGGTNDIMNLITSCRDCNRGKSDKEISDDSVIKKQLKQIEELAERREQLEMMLKWRDSMHDLKKDCIDSVCEAFRKNTRFTPNEYGRKEIKKWLNEFSLDEILNAIEIALDKYYEEDDSDSWEIAFSKVPGICHNRRIQETDKRGYYANYIAKVMRVNGWYCDKLFVQKFVYEFVDTEDDFEAVKRCLRISRNWTTFWRCISEEFEDYRQMMEE